MPFLPQNYELPTSSGESSRYFKPKKGINKVRILGDCITGYLYWNQMDKPVRSQKHPGIPADIREDDRVKHFWAMAVWDYEDGAIKVWEVTQRTIQEQIESLDEDPDWGHPCEYDLSIKREGEKLETKYFVTPKSKTPVSSEIAAKRDATPINLTALYVSGDPFNAPNTTGSAPPPSAASKSATPTLDAYRSMLGRATSVEQVDKAFNWVIGEKQWAAVASEDANASDTVQQLAAQAKARLQVATANGDIALEDIPY